MSNDKLLRIYLNDHLAAATAGLELVKRAASSNEGTPLGQFLQGLSEEIAEDRAALQRIIEDLGFRKDGIKVAAGWTAEKFGRLKLNGRIAGYSDLSRLIELEGLAVGIAAKRALWVSLRENAELDPRLATEHLDGLIERADRQKEAVEAHRREAAMVAFGN